MFSKSAGYRQTLLDAHAHSGNTKQGQPLKNKKKKETKTICTALLEQAVCSVIKVFLSMKRL